MRLVFSDTKKTGKGTFGAAVEDGCLILPLELEGVARQCGARNAETFYSVATGFPSAIMAACKWTLDEATAASQELRTQLRGHVSDALLDFDAAAQPKRTFGALPPKGWKPPHPQ